MEKPKHQVHRPDSPGHRLHSDHLLRYAPAFDWGSAECGQAFVTKKSHRFSGPGKHKSLIVCQHGRGLFRKIRNLFDNRVTGTFFDTGRKDIREKIAARFRTDSRACFSLPPEAPGRQEQGLCAIQCSVVALLFNCFVVYGSKGETGIKNPGETSLPTDNRWAR